MIIKNVLFILKKIYFGTNIVVIRRSGFSTSEKYIWRFGKNAIWHFRFGFSDPDSTKFEQKKINEKFERKRRNQGKG
jgi:hypothetical protein